MAVDEVKDLIRCKYKSEADCARSLGWTRQKLNKITTCKLEPDLADIDKLSVKLGVGFAFLAEIFLQYWSPNGQQNEIFKVEGEE